MTAPTTRYRILVAEDDPLLRELLVDTLATIGHDAVGVTDGLLALEQLQHAEFDLLLTDIRMPHMDGIALLNAVRTQHPQLPVAFISAYASEEILGAAKPDGFLSKPFRFNHVEELIENLLKRRRPNPAPAHRLVLVHGPEAFVDETSSVLKAGGYIPLKSSPEASFTGSLEHEQLHAVVIDDSASRIEELLATIEKTRHSLPVIVMSHSANAHEQHSANATANLHWINDRSRLIELLSVESKAPHTSD